MLRKLIDMLALWPRSIVGDREDIQHILNRSDAEALRSDWQAVGDDMRHAMDQMREDLAPPSTPKPDAPTEPGQGEN